MSIEVWTTGVGLLAAALSSLSYVPQVRKALPRGSTHDLSLTTLCILTTGLLLWCVYGVVRVDYVLVLANVVAAGLTGTVCICKWRDLTSTSNGTTCG
jgi:MtN3 and saliva related transmembrane protein